MTNNQPIKSDSNIKNSLDIIKRARDKTFIEFESKLNKLVVAELDDPPVQGITLSLDDEKPISKSKKKN